jgi:hypothetical protein
VNEHVSREHDRDDPPIHARGNEMVVGDVYASDRGCDDAAGWLSKSDFAHPSVAEDIAHTSREVFVLEAFLVWIPKAPRRANVIEFRLGDSAKKRHAELRAFQSCMQKRASQEGGWRSRLRWTAYKRCFVVAQVATTRDRMRANAAAL